MSKPNCYLIFADASYLSPDTYDNYQISLDTESPDIPTEQATINSNLIRQPRKCSLDLIFTPWPQIEDASPAAGPDRPQKAVAQLQTAWQLRQTCDLIVKDDVYKNCVVSVSYRNDQTDTIVVGLQVKELLIAQSATIKPGKLKKATGKKKKAVWHKRPAMLLALDAKFAVDEYFRAVGSLTQK